MSNYLTAGKVVNDMANNLTAGKDVNDMVKTLLLVYIV